MLLASASSFWLITEAEYNVQSLKLRVPRMVYVLYILTLEWERRILRVGGTGNSQCGRGDHIGYFTVLKY